jgi:hypothetical protein
MQGRNKAWEPEFLLEEIRMLSKIKYVDFAAVAMAPVFAAIPLFAMIAA